MYNRTTLVGRVGRDPVLHTGGKTPAASFSLATESHWTDGDGERQSATDWHNVVCFGGLAGVAEKIVNRGRLLLVDGRLQTSSYERDGVTHYRTEVVANELRVLGPRPAAAGEAADETAEEPEVEAQAPG